MKTMALTLTLERRRALAWLLLAFLLLGVAVSCATTGGDEPAAGDGMEMMDDHDNSHNNGGGEGHDHDDDGHAHDEVERVDNDGAVVRIVRPAEEVFTMKAGEELIVEVEVEGFALGVDGNHWHVYIDGASWGMITGGDTDTALRGIEPGEHKVEVYLAGGDHIDLREGDGFLLVVEE